MARDYICLYHSYLDAIQALGDAERGRLLTAMLEYSITGEAPQLGGNERFIFPLIKAQIDRDRERYEETCRKNSEKGRLGGRPKKAEKPAAFSESQESQGEGKGKEKGKGEEKGKDNAATAANAREAELGRVLSRYMDCIDPTPPSTVSQLLIGYTDTLSADVVLHAIDIADAEAKRSWNYIQAILQRYARSRLDTMDKVTADEAAHAQRRGRRGAPAVSYAQPTAEDLERMRKLHDRISGE